MLKHFGAPYLPAANVVATMAGLLATTPPSVIWYVFSSVSVLPRLSTSAAASQIATATPQLTGLAVCAVPTLTSARPLMSHTVSELCRVCGVHPLPQLEVHNQGGNMLM